MLDRQRVSVFGTHSAGRRRVLGCLKAIERPSQPFIMQQRKHGDERVYRWRRSDGSSLEVLRLVVSHDDVCAQSRIVEASAEPFAVEYEWRLDSSWHTRQLSVRVIRRDPAALLIERTGDAAWRVDGQSRHDLDGCDEIDLAVTPFCNTLALRRFGPPPGGPGELTTVYVGFPDLTCVRSRQRYERLGPSTFKYVDLGAYAGFEAQLIVDDQGIVQRYEGLFDLIEPKP
jgi:hypothetical protein